MAAPLSGIRVIEVANYVAGPAVGALMRDLGADVVKVEPPGGEVMRGVIVPGADGPYSANFLFELENRGKRSLTLDLGVAGASEVIHRLMDSADVFLTNLLAPRMEKYGLTPGDILARNPKAIVCSVTGYGIEGAEAARPGFDFAAFWARAGIMSVVGHPGGPPVLSRIAQGDHTTGINALAAILAALRLRDQTGEGQVVEVTLQQTGAYTIATDISRTLVDGKQPSRLDRDALAQPALQHVLRRRRQLGATGPHDTRFVLATLVRGNRRAGLGHRRALRQHAKANRARGGAGGWASRRASPSMTLPTGRRNWTTTGWSGRRWWT